MPGIHLKLDAQIGRLTGKIDLMPEALNPKPPFLSCSANGLDMFNRSYDIKVKTHLRLNGRFYGETANQALPRTRHCKNFQKHLDGI